MRGYREGGSFTSEGVEYDLDKALEVADTKPVRRFKVKDLDWVLKYDKPDPKRLAGADLKAPILVTKRTESDQLVAIDGLHRLAKAKAAGRKTLPGIYVDNKYLERVLEKQAKAVAAIKPIRTKATIGDLTKGRGGKDELTQLNRTNDAFKATDRMKSLREIMDEKGTKSYEQSMKKGKKGTAFAQAVTRLQAGAATPLSHELVTKKRML